MTTEAMARPDQRAGALDDHAAGAEPGRLPVMAAMAVPDASASRQPRPPQRAGPTVGLDDDMTDVPGVAEPALEQSAVEHDAAADAGRDDHGDVVVAPGRRTDPSLAERQRLGVVVHEGRQPGQRRPAATAGGRTATPRC